MECVGRGEGLLVPRSPVSQTVSVYIEVSLCIIIILWHNSHGNKNSQKK